MKRIILGTIVSAALVVGAASPAFAADHTQPGTPGTPNCHGQTVAYLNYAAANELDVHGIGGLSNATGLTVQQIQDIVTQYCGS
jgi:hypothetical protein